MADNRLSRNTVLPLPTPPHELWNMPRLSMNQLTTFRWSFEEDLYQYREAGYDGVGLWLRKLEDFGEERGIELLAESGLAVSNVLWAGGFTGCDAGSSEENLDASRRALTLAGRVRAGCLVLHAGGRNHHTHRHAHRLLRGAIDQLLPHAEAARVPLAVEPMHPACAAEWTILDNLEVAHALVTEYDTPWLRLVYDTYHFPLPEKEWGMLNALAPYIGVVHLGDGTKPHDLDQERCPLGEGRMPLEGIVDRLLRAGYDGFFDVELMGSDIGSACYDRLVRESLASCRGMMEPLAVGS